MVGRKIISVLTILLLLSFTCSAIAPEIYEWQVSDTSDFEEYVACGYGKKLVLSKDMEGKYVRFVFSDLYGNVSTSAAKGPVRFNTIESAVNFDDENQLIGETLDSSHYVNLQDGKLFAVNSDGKGSQSAWIPLSENSGYSDTEVTFALCPMSGHNCAKLIFCNQSKEPLFTINAKIKDENLVLTDSSYSQFHTEMLQTKIERPMQIYVKFNFASGKLELKNGDFSSWSETVQMDFSGKDISFLKVCNESDKCNLWLDDIKITSYRKDVKMWCQAEEDRTVSIEIKNYSKGAVSVKVLAAFLKNNKFVDFKTSDDILLNDFRNIVLDTDFDYDGVKVFLWESGQTLVPLSEVYICEYPVKP